MVAKTPFCHLEDSPVPILVCQPPLFAALRSLCENISPPCTQTLPQHFHVPTHYDPINDPINGPGTISPLPPAP